MPKIPILYWLGSGKKRDTGGSLTARFDCPGLTL